MPGFFSFHTGSKAKPSAAARPSSKWQWQLKRFSRLLWVRASLYAVLALATSLVAILLKPYVPEDTTAKLGADSVGDILHIIATSMLSVTTFSLGIIMAAFASASTSVTPRAAQLLMDDTTVQNSLATFLGAFLFSLTGIILLKTGVYGEGGRLVLFVVTIFVVVVIFIAFLRWIEILRRLGRVGDTIDRIEKVATESLLERSACPFFGGRPLLDPPPAGAVPLAAPRTGYVAHIHFEDLAKRASDLGAEIYLAALPGAFVNGASPLGWITAGTTEDFADIVQAWSIEDRRTFDHDIRYGPTVMAEVASRALSPAINDPGTAIEILGRSVRLLSQWNPATDAEITYPQLWVEPLQVADLLDDFFRPIARDGASTVELLIRLQKSLLALIQQNPAIFTVACLDHSNQVVQRAEQALAIESDKKIIRQLHQEILLACPSSAS